MREKRRSNHIDTELVISDVVKRYTLSMNDDRHFSVNHIEIHRQNPD